MIMIEKLIQHYVVNIRRLMNSIKPLRVLSDLKQKKLSDSRQAGMTAIKLFILNS
jgi:hypothetical protein